MIGHAGGVDEMLFVLVPVLVFVVLQWLSRRKPAETPPAEPDTADRLEHRRRLAGGLLGEPQSQPERAEEPPEDPPADGR